MNLPSLIVLAVIAVAFALAMRRLIRLLFGRGGCHGGGGGCHDGGCCSGKDACCKK